MTRSGFVLLLALAGCGVRHVARPTNVADYKPVPLAEVTPLGLADLNVELEGAVASIGGDEACGGLVTIALMPPVSPDAPLAGGSVTLTLPRSRFEEVRHLRSLQRVRVRGYLSAHEAEGCDGYVDADTRFLWVDSIEPVTSASR